MRASVRDRRPWPARALVVSAAALILVLLPAPAQGARHDGPHCGGKRATLHAGSSVFNLFGFARRDNVIVGSARDEKLRGGKGDDGLCALGGRDLLRGRRGTDRLQGGVGGDRLIGGKGRDRLIGAKGRDKIRAGAKRDRVRAGRGPDNVKSRDDLRDKINCGAGSDTAHVDNHDALRNCERVKLGGMPDFALPSWSDGLWSDASAYDTIRTGDIDGDGKDELVGRSPFGIETYRFDPGTGQWIPMYAGADPELNDPGGWDEPQYYSTIQLGDVNGDGADELLARAGGGLHVWHFDSSSRTWSEVAKPLADLSDNESWDEPQYYSTIQTGNLIGGKEEELFARGVGGVYAWQLQGDSWKTLAASGPFDDHGGWNQPTYYETIHAANLLGDDHVELYGRATDGIHLYQLAPPGWNFLQQDTNTDLGNNFGWTNPSWYPTIQAADLDGDGYDDILGRASDGLHSWRFANGKWSQNEVLTAFEDREGWNQSKYFESIQTAQLGRAPIDAVIGRGPDGLEAYEIPSDWEKLPVEGDLSDSAGWGNDRYGATIRSANVHPGGGKAILARGLTGVQSFGFDAQRNSWETLSAEFPSFDSGEQAIAYKAINAYIGGADNPSFDLRQAYPDALGSQLDEWRQDLTQVPQPSGVTTDVWDAVKAQLDQELQNGKLVLSWYDDASAGGYLHTLIDQKFMALSMDTSAEVLKLDTQSHAEMEMEEWASFEGALEGLGGLDVLEGPAGEVAVVTTSLLGGAMTAGLGEPDVDSALNTVEEEYVTLRDDLNADYQKAIHGIGDAKIEIQSDYGAQSAVAGLIGSGFWKPLTGDPRAIAIATAEKNYDVLSWKTITPAIWTGMGFYSNAYQQVCGGPTDFYTSCDWTDPQGTGWIMCEGSPSSGCRGRDFNLGMFVPQGLRDKLFGQTSQGCQTTWNLSSCSLGVSAPDVFPGNDGWHPLHTTKCKNDVGIFMTCKQQR